MTSQTITPSEIPPTETVPAPRAIAPVVMVAPRRDLPQAKHFHGGALRLFAMTGLVCAGMFGYWLATGKPEFRSAVTYFHIFPTFLPAANNDSAASPDLGAAEERSSSVNPSPQPAAAATAPSLASDPTATIAQGGTKTTERNSRSSKAIANMQAPSGNPPIGLNIPCTSPLCDNASPNPLSAAEFSTTESRPFVVAFDLRQRRAKTSSRSADAVRQAERQRACGRDITNRDGPDRGRLF